jgi:murein L,D-transpeptidase YafK
MKQIAHIFLFYLFVLQAQNLSAVTLLQQKLDSLKVSTDSMELFLRVFKKEQKLEVWVKNKKDANFQFLEDYKICGKSGDLGPKRKEGDLQIPEGFYYIDRYEPQSYFHKALKINYPNPADKVQGHQETPGNDIFIHGACVSTGCIALSNQAIEDIYWLADKAKAAGQNFIDVHIYPFHFEEYTLEDALKNNPKYKDYEAFWESLRSGFFYFEQQKTIPDYRISREGFYVIVK